MSTMPASGPAGSRRFWVAVLCFALANAAVWIGYDRFVRHRSHPLLEVAQSAPADQAQVWGRATFWWTFNLDVAPPVPNAPAPGTISPPVAGKWEWSNARTLNFVPDAPLSRATAYTVTLLPDRLQTTDGFRLAKPHVTAVHTAPLQVVRVRQLALDERDQLVLEVEFNDDVIPAEALQHLSVKTPENKPVAFRSHGEATAHSVRVITDPVPAPNRGNDVAYLKVEISPGLTGRSGPLGLTSAYADQVSVGSELIATGAHSYFAQRSDTVLRLQFNNPADPAILRPLLSVEPAVPFTVSRGYDGLELRGAFQPSTRYAIKIAQAPAGIPRASRPRADTLSVFVPDRAPSVWFEHDEGYLGSTGNRTLLAHAVNVAQLHATVTRIYDNNLVTWRNTRVGIDSVDRPIAERDIRLPALKNKTQDVRLSLDDLLSADQSRDGVYFVRLGTTSNIETDPDEDRGYGRWQAAATVTLSDIALTAKKGRTGVTVWATSLRTAEPLPGVRTRLYSSKNQFLGEAVTRDDGLATIVPVPTAEGEEPGVVLADRPDARSAGFTTTPNASSARDLTWLDLRGSRINFGESETTGASYLRTGHEAFVYTDRGVYRPGETVHLRAIVRGPDGATPPSFPVRWQFRRPDLHNWKSFDAQIDPDGAVSLDLLLPNDLPTGHWSVALGLPGNQKEEESFGSGSFQVEDFMPNRMQVGLKLDGTPAGVSDGQEPRFAATNEPLSAEVQADYLFGKPVSERPARLVARLDPATFSSPKWAGWTFGDSATTAQTLEGLKITGHRTELPEQTLDANGHAAFDLDLQSLLSGDETSVTPTAPKSKRSRRAHTSEPKVQGKSTTSYVGPWRLSVTASVIETGGRAVSASTQAQLDPVPWYIGVVPKNSSAAGSLDSSFELALVSPDGSIAARDLALDATLYRESWNNSLAFESGHYVYHSTRLLNGVGEPMQVRIEHGRGSAQASPPGFGSYVLRVKDPKSGCMTSIAFYAGQGAWEDNISRENPEKLELLLHPMPDASALMRSIRGLDPAGAWAAARAMLTHPGQASKLRAGDMAQVIVRSPFAGRLLLSVETDDVVSTRVIDMPASHVSIPIQIPELCRPNAYVTATVVRSVDPDATWQTHRAIGTLRMPIDNTDRKLDIQLSAPAEIRPATSLGVALRVTDSNGAPVRSAAVTVAAVDEGICQLTGFTTPDPFAFFTSARALGVGTSDLFSELMPEVPQAQKISPVGGDKDAYDPRHQSPVSARRVKPVSLVSGVLHTDSDGLARADFSVPRFTGKLRLMAVGSAGPSFGSNTGAVLVRSPLLVQSSWPRFAAPGDKFVVPLAIFNNLPAACEASVTLHVTDGPLHMGEASEFTTPVIKLAANGQATQFVEVHATNDVGVSHVTLIARGNGESYEEDVEIPVRPASPEISLGGYAVATPAKPAEISLPGGMLKGTEHFEVKVTPWPSLQLPQGLDYLERYPYGCLEQTTSTLFPLVYLSDIGQRIGPGVFEKQRVADKVQAGIVRLIGMQTSNGGLAMWPAFREPWPWGSVYAAHFLIEAQNAGHPVPEEFRKQLLGYVRSLLNQSSDNPDVLETQAYACYVLALAGKPERAVMSRLAEVVNTPRPDGVVLPGQARLHLAGAWLASGRRDLAESLIPQQLPAPRATRSLAGALGSPIRDRAILVNTLLEVEPEHPALPGLVQQLADSGRKGQWRSTQDTAFAVMALGRYLRQSKTVAPYDGAEMYLGEARVGQVESGNPLLWDAGINGAALPEDGSKLKIRVTGAAETKAHVSWLQAGVPLVPPQAADHGLSVRRQFLDERGKPLAANRVRSGDLVQVELTISSDTPLEYIAIDDLLPAGLEIENPRLLTTAAEAAEPTPGAQPVNVFHDSRLDMRDDRLILIGDLTAAGKGTYVYTARAVTAGKFVLPPVHAECMYDTATNSLSPGGTFEVLPAGSPRVANVQD